MNHIELKELVLTNYRNTSYGTYQFDGNSKIIGDNGVGKTNTLEAIVWLLTDKLLNGSSDIAAIKPLDDTKKEVVAKATFLVNGTDVVNIKKEYKEKWVKARGTNELSMQGHTTTYYFNDVKQGTLKDYNREVAEAFGLHHDDLLKIDYERLLIDPFYLGDLGDSKDWTNLHSLIIKIIGDVKDDDVFAKEPKLLPIKETLTKVGGKVEQAKKLLGQTITSIKTQITADEAQIKLLSETERPTDEQIALAKKGIEEHETNIANLRANKGTDEISKKLEGEIVYKKAQILAHKEKVLADYNNDPTRVKSKEINAEIDRLLSNRSVINTRISSIENDIDRLNNSIVNYESNHKELTERVKDIVEHLKGIVVDTKCPYCGGELSQDRVQELIDKARTDLNTQKDIVVNQGKENRVKWNIALEQLETKKQELEAESVESHTLLNKIQDKQHELETLVSTPIEEHADVELEKLEKELFELGQKLSQSRSQFALGQQDVNSQIYQEQEEIKPFQKVLDDLSYYNRQQDKLVEVKATLQEHEKNLVDNEQNYDLLSKFILVKLNMLDENVSKKFGNIKFQLIQNNINGGYDVVCKPYIYDVEHDKSTNVVWKSGSKSERVATGIAIAEKVKQALNLPSLPYLFDEGGEISTDTFKNRLKTDSQIICVKVQDGIPKPMVAAIE